MGVGRGAERRAGERRKEGREGAPYMVPGVGGAEGGGGRDEEELTTPCWRACCLWEWILTCSLGRVCFSSGVSGPAQQHLSPHHSLSLSLSFSLFLSFRHLQLNNTARQACCYHHHTSHSDDRHPSVLLTQLWAAAGASPSEHTKSRRAEEAPRRCASKRRTAATYHVATGFPPDAQRPKLQGASFPLQARDLKRRHDSTPAIDSGAALGFGSLGCGSLLGCGSRRFLLRSGSSGIGDSRSGSLAFNIHPSAAAFARLRRSSRHFRVRRWASTWPLHRREDHHVACVLPAGSSIDSGAALGPLGGTP